MDVKTEKFFTNPRPPTAERRKRKNERDRQRWGSQEERGRRMDETMTFREKLNMALCLNGVLNDRAVRLFSGSQNYKLKVMCRLREKGWVEKKNSVTRFTKDTLEIVSCNTASYPYGNLAKERRDAYVTSGKQHRQRIMRHGETIVMMIESGIELYESDLADLPNRITYVRGSRIKEQQEYRDKQALMRSRSMGTVFVGSEAVYNIYTLGTRNQIWEPLAEHLSKEIVERISQNQYGKALQCKAAVLVDNLEILKSMTRETKRGGGIIAGNVYPELYVLPKSEMGTRLLGIMVLPGTEQILSEMVDEEEALNFIVPNAAKMRQYRLRHGNGGKVWCLKGYEGGIKSAMPEAEINTVEIDEAIEWVISRIKED